MKTHRTVLAAAFAVVTVGLVMLACDMPSPTAPSVFDAVASATQNGAPSTASSPVPAGGLIGSFDYARPDEAKVTVINTSDHDQFVHLVSYCVTEKDDNTKTQYRKAIDLQNVPHNGKPVVFKVVGCGCRTQYDVGFGEPFPPDAPPNYPKLVPDGNGQPLYRIVGSNLCPVPTPPHPSCVDSKLTFNFAQDTNDRPSLTAITSFSQTVSVLVGAKGGVVTLTWSDGGSDIVSSFPSVVSHTYARDGKDHNYTITASLNDANGRLCPASKTLKVHVTAVTCGELNVNGSASVSGTSATVSASWSGGGAGSISLDGGSSSSIANGGSKMYNGISEGSHSAVITVVDGDVTCQKTVSFTIARTEICFCHVSDASDHGDFSSNNNPVHEENLCLPPSGFEGHGGVLTPPPPHFPVPNNHGGGTHKKDYMGACDGRSFPK